MSKLKENILEFQRQTKSEKKNRRKRKMKKALAIILIAEVGVTKIRTINRIVNVLLED